MEGVTPWRALWGLEKWLVCLASPRTLLGSEVLGTGRESPHFLGTRKVIYIFERNVHPSCYSIRTIFSLSRKTLSVPAKEDHS